MSAATFTLTLQEAYEFSGGTATIGPDGVSILSGGNIGLDYYPLCNVDYRGTLNGKIYDHYMLLEIGFETIEIFAQRMRSMMNNIMPFYNELYKTQLNLVDPLRTVDINVVMNAIVGQHVEGTNETVADSETKAGTRTIQSDFPQYMLSGDSDYASAGADANATTTVGTTGNDNSTTQSDTDQHTDSSTTGYQGIPGEIIAAYRATILNIDLMIISELEPMFMQLFNNGDAYTQQRGLFG